MTRNYETLKPLADEEIRRILDSVDHDAPLPEIDPLPKWVELVRNAVGYDWSPLMAAMRDCIEIPEEMDRREVVEEACRQLHMAKVYVAVLENDFNAVLVRAAQVYQKHAAGLERMRIPA